MFGKIVLSFILFLAGVSAAMAQLDALHVQLALFQAATDELIRLHGSVTDLQSSKALQPQIDAVAMRQIKAENAVGAAIRKLDPERDGRQIESAYAAILDGHGKVGEAQAKARGIAASDLMRIVTSSQSHPPADR